MRIYLAADHDGFSLKEKIKSWLNQAGYQVEDCGAASLDTKDDYPDFALTAAQEVAKQPESRLGIMFCYSGGGMVIAANKVRGIRAVYIDDIKGAKHAKKHNNANMISLAADWLDEATAKKLIKAFIETEFTNEARHVRRINKISQFEAGSS